MMKKVVCSAVIVGLTTVSAECPNACNGHGKCTSYDMCICNRNWQANDCSERVCQFGLAHVDTPKGDLDMSGTISGPDLTVAENSFNYPYGTSEQFPQGRDSDLVEVMNSAHYYMECSNKGTCNRDTGECACFDGYDGAACQRASCPGWPNVCSGHGVCKSIRQLAAADGHNIYELWDKHATMGCECDDGFDGPDCSERKCKFGVDPLYYDDSTTIRYATWDFAIITDNSDDDFTDGMVDDQDASFAIRFFDMHGEDWVTEPLKYHETTCDELVAALEKLPNEVIPVGSLECVMTHQATRGDPFNAGGFATGSNWQKSCWDLEGSMDGCESETHDRIFNYPLAFWEYSPDESAPLAAGVVSLAGKIFRVKFGDNPGALQQPEIEIFLDGKRPSLTSEGTVVTKVWTDGQQGESVDYFADLCAGVTVTIDTSVGGYQILSGMTLVEKELLKTCLGGADFDVHTNTEKYDWDYGSDETPHLVKLILTTASSTDGGYYVALMYVGDDDEFVLFNQFKPLDGLENDNYDVYTTKGVLIRSSGHEAADIFAYANFGFASNEIQIIENPDAEDTFPLRADLSCEINDNNYEGESADTNKKLAWTRYEPDSQTTCLNKTHIFTLLSSDVTNNPAHINLYRVKKIYQKQFFDKTYEDKFRGTYVIETDISTNWASYDDYNMAVYKFFPATESSYTYVSQCSNRGICNTDSGLCECFHGYTDDDCSAQNSLAV